MDDVEENAPGQQPSSDQSALLTSVQSLSARCPGSPLTQTLVVGALVGLLTFRLLKKRPNLPPGPRPLPLLGNLLSMRSKEEQFYVTLDRWAREKYGPVISVYFGPVLCVMLNDFDSVNEALVQKGSDFAGRPSLHSLKVLSEGFKDIAFTDYSPTWKLHRRIAMKALRHYSMGPHLDKVVHKVMTACVDKMAAEPGPFDPHPYISTLMFHIIDCICFGEVKDFDDLTLAVLIERYDVVNREFGNGFLEDVVPLLKYWPTKSFKRFSAMFEEILEYLDKNIEKHRQNFSPDDICDVTGSILLAQKEAEKEESAEAMAMFTDVHVRQTISNVFGAGVDTSRVTLDWALLYMAGHPEIQRRAQAEIDAATGTEMPCTGHRGQLQYTQAVFWEILRLSSVGPTALPHKALRDTTVGGYDVPKDTVVMVNLWAVTHDPTLWPQPHKFMPERFLDEKGNLPPLPKAFLPFSAGRRACLGETVAKPELLLLLTCFLKWFTFTLPPGATYDPECKTEGITIHSPKPYKIVVTRR